MSDDLYNLLLFKVQKVESSKDREEFLNNLFDLYFTVQYSLIEEKPIKLNLERKDTNE